SRMPQSSENRPPPRPIPDLPRRSPSPRTSSVWPLPSSNPRRPLAMSDERDPAPLARRGFLGLMAPALLLSGLPASRAMAGIPARGLVIHHQHTGEWLRTVYFADGRYIPSSLRDVDRVLRDWRTDQITAIDPRVLDIVTFLQRRLQLAGPLEVVC